MITLRKVSRHIFAVLACVVFFAVVPLALYGSWVIPRTISAADLGGPLNFVHYPRCRCVLRIRCFDCCFSATQLALRVFQLSPLVAHRRITRFITHCHSHCCCSLLQPRRWRSDAVASSFDVHRFGSLPRRWFLCLFVLRGGLSQDVP